MKFLTITMILLMTSYSYAESGHGHSHGHGSDHKHKVVNIKKSQASKIALKNKERLIKLKKIDSSWAEAKLTSSVIKEFNSKKEWLITFSNDKGVKGKTLYIFLSLSGDFIAANFTGK